MIGVGVHVQQPRLAVAGERRARSPRTVAGVAPLGDVGNGQQERGEPRDAAPALGGTSTRRPAEAAVRADR